MPAGGHIIQKKKGYRFSVDAVLLAAMAMHYRYTPRTRYLDIGTGCGIIPLLLASRFDHLHGYGVELQNDLADVARRNCILRGVANRIEILCMDVKDLRDRFPSGCFDVITSNPPYRPAASGRINPDPQKAVARHEIHMTLEELLSVVAYLLRNKGTCFLIYAASRAVELFTRLREVHLEPKRIRPVYPNPCSNANMLLVEAVLRGNPQVAIEPPLFIRDAGGNYSKEMQAIYEMDP